MKLISYIRPTTRSGGHDVPYQKALAQAAATLHWHFVCGVSSRAREAVFPFMRPVFPEAASGKADRIRYSLGYMYKFRRFLARETEAERSPAIFADWPVITELAVLAFLLPSLKKRGIQLWLMVRRIPRKGTLDERAYRYFVRFALDSLGSQFRLVTDSEVVARYGQDKFKVPWIVLPIPHLETLTERRAPGPSRLRFWWPGIPRAEKGLRIIAALAKTPSKEVALVLSEGAPTAADPAGPPIAFVPQALAHDKYWELFRSVDAVLLPYEPSSYFDGTSGIFVEAMSAGAIPFVTAGTWMAGEARRLNLSELIIEPEQWGGEGVLDSLAEIVRDAAFREKFDLARKVFVAGHGPAAFAAALGSLAKAS